MIASNSSRRLRRPSLLFWLLLAPYACSGVSYVHLLNRYAMIRSLETEEEIYLHFEGMVTNALGVTPDFALDWVLACRWIDPVNAVYVDKHFAPDHVLMKLSRLGGADVIELENCGAITRDGMAILAMTSLSRVVRLRILYTPLPSDSIQSLASCRDLKELQIYGTTLRHADIIALLDHLPQIEMIDLVGGESLDPENRLGAERRPHLISHAPGIDSALANAIGRHPTLHTVGLTGHTIGDEFLEALAPLKTPPVLALAHTRVSADGLATFLSHKPRLTQLYIDHHMVNRRLCHVLAEWPAELALYVDGAEPIASASELESLLAERNARIERLRRAEESSSMVPEAVEADDVAGEAGGPRNEQESSSTLDLAWPYVPLEYGGP